MPSATLLGRDIDVAFLIIAGVCALLFVVVISLMLYFASRYRKERSGSATDIEGHAPLELSFLGVSVALVLALFYVGWGPYFEVRRNAPAGAMKIMGHAQTWSWSFEYDNGMTSPRLFIPVNTPVRMQLTSADLIHSFYVPAFRIKQDIVPGSQTDTWFIADKTGEYDLMCTEYCGTGHSGMLSKAVVVSESEFEVWKAGGEAVPEEKKKAEPQAQAAEKKPSGEALFKEKGCSACHSVDGSKSVGPTLKGVYGSKVKVVANGKEKEVTVDDEYIRRSELEPNAEVVAGFQPIMPPQKGILKEEEIKAIMEYIKTLK